MKRNLQYSRLPHATIIIQDTGINISRYNRVEGAPQSFFVQRTKFFTRIPRSKNFSRLRRPSEKTHFARTTRTRTRERCELYGAEGGGGVVSDAPRRGISRLKRESEAGGDVRDGAKEFQPLALRAQTPFVTVALFIQAGEMYYLSSSKTAAGYVRFIACLRLRPPPRPLVRPPVHPSVRSSAARSVYA